MKNWLALLTVPLALVTLMTPVVAPAGTRTSNRVLVAALTVAVTPLNLTVLAAGVELKPVP